MSTFIEPKIGLNFLIEQKAKNPQSQIPCPKLGLIKIILKVFRIFKL